MGNLAVHMRITDIEVTDVVVDTRNLAVKELVDTWAKIKFPKDIIAKAGQIANSIGGNGTPDPSLAQEVEAVIQKHASAFLASERPLEVGICAGVAMTRLLASEPGTSGWTSLDIYATAMWLALEFQPPLIESKRENLRMQVLDSARKFATSSADLARSRSDVPDFAELTIASGEDNKLSSNFKRATATTINALRRNAALDREELDFLWWVQLNRSRFLERPFNAITEPVRLIVMGMEAAELLRRLPAQVHRELVLRTLNDDPSLTIEEVLVEIGEDRKTLEEWIDNDFIADKPIVFPFLHALITGTSRQEGSELSRASSEWGTRALLEATLANLSISGIGLL